MVKLEEELLVWRELRLERLRHLIDALLELACVERAERDGRVELPALEVALAPARLPGAPWDAASA